MKKIISVIVLTVTLLSLIYVPSVSYAYNDDSLVFNLDMSNYDTSSSSESKGLTDTVNSQTVKVFGTPTKEIVDVNETEKTVLRFSNTDKSNANAHIEVTAPYIINQDTLTMEFWAKPHSLKTGVTLCDRMFAVTNGYDASSTFEVMLYNTEIRIRPGNTKATGGDNFIDIIAKMPQCNDRWNHFVFMRSWNSDNTAVSYKTYVNGTLVVGMSGTATGVRRDESASRLYIGSNSNERAFLGSIGSFKVYNAELSPEKILDDYYTEYGDYHEIDTTLYLTSTLPDSTISAEAGEIDLTFNTAIDQTTLNHITFTKADGSPVRGGVYKSVSDDGKTISLSHGTLEHNSDYILNIPSTVKTIYNKYFEGKKVTLTAKRDCYLWEDFSGDDYVVNSLAPMNKGITYMSRSVNNDNSLAVVKKTASGKKYVSLITDTKGKDTKASYIPTTPISNDDIIVELVVRASDVGAARDILRVNGTNRYADYRNKYVLIKGRTLAGVDSVDSDGFHHIKSVLRKDTDGNYAFYMYNMLSPETLPVIYSGEETGFSSLKNLQLLHIYPMEESHVSQSSDLAMAKIYVHKDLKIINVSDVSDNSLYVTFSDDVDATTFRPGNIKVLKSGAEISEAYLTRYDALNRRLIITFPKGLETGDDYSISLSGINDTHGYVYNYVKDFSCLNENVSLVDTVDFKDADGNSIVSLKGKNYTETTVSLKNNYNTEIKATTVLALYEGGQIAEKSVVTKVLNPSEEASFTNSLDLSEYDLSENHNVKLFIWNGNGSYNPIIGVPDVLPYEYNPPLVLKDINDRFLFEFTVPDYLMASTVSKDAFLVRSKHTGKYADVKEVMYEPKSKSVRIYTDAVYDDEYIISANEVLKDKNGASVNVNKNLLPVKVKLNAVYSAGIDRVFVYSKNEPINSIKGQSNITLKAVFLNTAQSGSQSLNINVYNKYNPSVVYYNSNLNIGNEGKTEVLIPINGYTFLFDDEIVLSVSNN